MVTEAVRDVRVGCRIPDSGPLRVAGLRTEAESPEAGSRVLGLRSEG